MRARQIINPEMQGRMQQPLPFSNQITVPFKLFQDIGAVKNTPKICKLSNIKNQISYSA